MKDKAKAMVLASFAADSLALAPHWIYSINKIARDFGRIENFLDPDPDSYHHTKKKGDFTHYGDQSFMLLESLAARGSFDPEDSRSAGRSSSQDMTATTTRPPRAPSRTFL